MPENVIWRLAIPTPLRRIFDYLPCDSTVPAIGARIRVPFGRRELVGFLWEVTDKSSCDPSKLKKALEVIDEAPVFNPSLRYIIQWASQYYHAPIGEVCGTGLPAGIRQGKPLRPPLAPAQKAITPAPFDLSDEQESAWRAVSEHLGSFKAFCLEGVTGSGKTEVYCKIIEDILNRDQQALLLVPEISLTPQTLSRFKARFGETVAAFHSTLTDKQRHEVWTSVAEGTRRVIIGTRSAVFLPFRALGGICIDEEHDAAFKQQEGFRYHARDIALVRAAHEKCPVVLGSATPSLETLRNISLEKYTHLVLKERVSGGQMPTIRTLDVRHKKLDGGISAQVIKAIRGHLADNAQVLIFLNRRGFSPCWMCFDCGWLAKCNRCDRLLTYHQNFDRLWCHHCNRQLKTVRECPECAQAELNAVGSGTERLEQVLGEAFPEASIVRFDSDSTRKKGALQDKLSQVAEGEADILIGTQLLTKGHHFAKVRCVVVVDADGGLFSQDFKALERLGQMITQVAGRAGRENAGAEVIVQTCHPKHPLLITLLQKGYPAFAKQLLSERSEAALPPFGHMALIRCTAPRLDTAMNFLAPLSQFSTEAAQVMGPIPASMPKRAGQFRAQAMLVSSSRNALHLLLRQCLDCCETAKTARAVRWSVDVDPVDTF